MGWLRTSLAQRFVDHHRRTHREEPLEDDAGFAATESTPTPPPEELAALSRSLAAVLEDLPAEDRFLLSAYFLDQRTLQQIAQVLRVHEATISRRLKRLTVHLREQLLKNLHASGMSRRAAEEALGTDPRDLSVNLRSVLQTSATPAFSLKEAEVRVPMSERLQSGLHLDAEILNAFAEGALPAYEREQALAHLAVCADCREIVFLAEQAQPVPAADTQAESTLAALATFRAACSALASARQRWLAR